MYRYYGTELVKGYLLIDISIAVSYTTINRLTGKIFDINTLNRYLYYMKSLSISFS